MKEINLHSKKYSGLIALIDNEDFDLVNQYRWNPQWGKCSHTFYTYGHIPGKGSGERPLIFMHRLILDVRPDEQIDHVDHNGLNNQKVNLRICSQSQNSANGRSSTGTSKFKGVCWHKRDKIWCVQIRSNYKLISLGYFDDETKAAKVYDKKAIELFGEFALTNF